MFVLAWWLDCTKCFRRALPRDCVNSENMHSIVSPPCMALGGYDMRLGLSEYQQMAAWEIWKLLCKPPKKLHFRQAFCDFLWGSVFQ